MGVPDLWKGRIGSFRCFSIMLVMQAGENNGINPLHQSPFSELL
jgi:hypothetical protein